MLKRWNRPILAVLVLMLTALCLQPAVPALAGLKTYWVWVDDGAAPGQGSIKYTERGFIDPVNLISGLNAPTRAAMDPISNKIYWIDNGDMRIQRANLDGSSVEDVVPQSAWQDGDNPNSIALDLTNGMVYWTNLRSDGGLIQRTALNGGPITTVVTGLSYPRDLGLDVARNLLYFTDTDTNTNTAYIQWGDLGGGNLDFVTVGGAGCDPDGLALDLNHRRVFWVDSGPAQKIRTANLLDDGSVDGSSIADLIVDAPNAPVDIFLDPDGTTIYWLDVGTSANSGRIRGADLTNRIAYDVHVGLAYPYGFVRDYQLTDNAGPTITSATSTSAPGLYGLNGTVNITLNFSEPVTSAGLRIDLNSGGFVVTPPLDYVMSCSVVYTVGAGQLASPLNVSSVTGAVADSAAPANVTANPAVPAGFNISNFKTIAVDSVPPTALSIHRSAPAGAMTNAASVAYAVTFDEPVFGLTAANFTLPVSGITGASITSMSRVGNTWTVVVNTGTGNGTLGLDLANATGVTDAAGNALALLPPVGQTYTIDKTPPTVLSINRYAPAAALTNAATVTYAVTFSEAVAGLAAANFSVPVTGIVGASVSSVTGAGNAWTVVVNTGTGDGMLGLNLANSTGVADAAGNAVALLPFAGETYTIDKTPPTVVSINRTTPAGPLTNAANVSYTVTFSEAVTGLAAANFSLPVAGIGGTSISSIGGAGTTWTVVVNTGTGDGTLSLNLANSTGVSDAVGNTVAVLPFAGQTYTIDKTPPTVTAINRSSPAGPATNAASVTYTVSISEAVSGLTAANFNVPVTGISGATITSVTGSGTTWSVAVNTGTGDGALGLNLANATGVVDAAGNALGSPSFTGQTYTIDKTPPTVVSINRTTPAGPLTNAASVTYTVTFSEAVHGVTAGNFSVPVSGITGAVIASAAAGIGNTWTVVVNTGTGSGSLVLNLSNSVGATDAAGNAVASLPVTGQTYTIDKTPPSVVSISRTTPAAAITNVASVTYTVSFSEAVTGLAAANFSVPVAGISGAAVSSVTPGGGNTWTVAVNTGAGDGTLGLNLVNSAGMADAAANAVAPLPFAGQTYTIDKTAPVIVIGPPSATLTRGGPVTYTLTYSGEDTISLVSANVTLNRTGTASGSVSVGGTTGHTRTVTIASITGEGTLGISLAAGTAGDAAGNTAPAAGPGTPFAVDNSAPAVAISAPSALRTRTGPITYTITYTGADSVTLADSDMTLKTSGTANGTVAVTGTGTATRTVTVSNTTGDGTLAIRLAAGTASDSAGNLAAAGNSTSFTVDNTAPILSIGTPSVTQTVTGPVDFTLTYSGADTVNLTEGKVTLNPTGSAKGTVSVTDGTTTTPKLSVSNITGVGTLSVSVQAGTASDSAGNTAEAAGPSSTVTVLNVSPVATDENYSTPEDTPLEVAAPGFLKNDTDPNGDSLTALLDSTTKNGKLTFHADGSFTYLPNHLFNGTDAFTYRASDGTNNSNVATVTITVATVNNPPVASAGPDQTVYPSKKKVILDGSSSADPEHAIVSYKWTQTRGPRVTLEHAGSARARFRIPDLGSRDTSLTFRLTVTDRGGLTSDSDCMVNISHSNLPPIADAGPDRQAAAAAKITLDGSNSADPDDRIAAYKWIQKSGPRVNLTNRRAARLSFAAPAVGPEGATLAFELTVTDRGRLRARDRVMVQVVSQNLPPVAHARPDQTVNAGERVNLDGLSSTDPDGSVLTYQWSQLDGPAVTLSDPLGPNPSFAAPRKARRGASLTFRLIATDRQGLASRDTCIVNVTTGDRPPKARAGADQTASPGSTVTLHSRGSSLWSQTVWTQLDGPPVELSNPLELTPSFTAPEVGPDGASLVFELTVTDHNGLRSRDSCAVRVTAGKPTSTIATGTE